MHLLRHHLDFGTRATSNLLVSRLCHTPSVQPFSSRSWSVGGQVAPAILLCSHILQLVLGIPGHSTSRCASKSLQHVLGLPQVSDYFESSSTRRRPGGALGTLIYCKWCISMRRGELGHLTKDTGWYQQFCSVCNHPELMT